MSTETTYQKKKKVADLLENLDKSQRKMLREALVAEWAETLPQSAKDYGVTGGGGKFAERLEFLQEHWGTDYKTKGKDAVRKMSLSGVIELLTVFALNTADSEDKELSFGSLDDGSKLSETVTSGLFALKDSPGKTKEISQSEYDELQKIRREYEQLKKKMDTKAGGFGS